MTSLLPNFATRLNQLDGQITRIWKLVRNKIGSVITTNSDGTITLGSATRPISNIIMNSCVYFGVLSGDAYCLRNAIGNASLAWSQDGRSKTAMRNTYLGLFGVDYSVMRDFNGDAISVITSDGFYARAINGIDHIESFQDYLINQEIPYNLPPPNDLIAEKFNQDYHDTIDTGTEPLLPA